MKLTKSTVAATFAALLIGGLSISSVSAAPHQTGRVYTDTGTQAGYELKGDTSYNSGRSAPTGEAQPVLKSESNRSNGRQG
jgi:hypothetical protein